MTAQVLFSMFFSKKDPHLNAVEFTDVNDQLSYFVKTLNITKESFIPRKKCFINSRNHIKLDKTAQSKLRKNQKIMETVPQNNGHQNLH